MRLKTKVKRTVESTILEKQVRQNTESHVNEMDGGEGTQEGE